MTALLRERGTDRSPWIGMAPEGKDQLSRAIAADASARGELGASELLVFDFISHEHMHHAFNEEYLRILRAAFPSDRIVFHAVEGHVARLTAKLHDIGNIELRACEPFHVPFGLSRHNPIGGRLAASACLEAMAKALTRRRVRMVSLLGVDANLYAVMRRRWRGVSGAPLHMILHGQLGDAMIWRSRNPFIRAGDFIAALRRPLPDKVNLVALELGVKEAIGEIAPRTASSVLTLEHPVLASEWANAAAPAANGKTRIAFLGHARRAKGFPAFVAMARDAKRADLEFQAIGLASPDTAELDVGDLSRGPTPDSMPRAEYLAALRDIDLVCLPLHGRAYDFTASGTVSDAIAALKPVVAIRNKPLEAIERHYGEIGYLVPSEAGLAEWVRTFDRADFERRRPLWIANLRKIREARRPEQLAANYALTVA